MIQSNTHIPPHPETVGDLMKTIKDFSKENRFMVEEGWEAELLNMVNPPKGWFTAKPVTAPAVESSEEWASEENPPPRFLPPNWPGTTLYPLTAEREPKKSRFGQWVKTVQSLGSYFKRTEALPAKEGHSPDPELIAELKRLRRHCR